MRISRLAIIGFLIALQATAADSTILSLKIDILNLTVKLGDEIRIRITITNESSQPVTFHETNPFCNYPLKVLDYTGNTAPPTEFMKQIGCEFANAQTAGRNILVFLKPGESHVDSDMEVTEVCVISEPGEYSVEVDRIFSGIGLVRSNVVKVSITP
jgi:hypothetical protein